MAAGWDPGPSDQPLPPINGMVVSPFMAGVLDVRWDDPSILGGNSGYTVVGVNIYRSDVSDRGPFFRINEFPVGGSFYRDYTNNVLISQEVVNWDTSWISKGTAANDRRWVFQTRYPIVKAQDTSPYTKSTPATSTSDVTVTVGGVVVQVHDVFGPSREVTLINQATINTVTEQYDDALLPSATVPVSITYHTNRNYVRTGLGAKVCYRLTTVVLDSTTPSGYKETALPYCIPLLSIETERLDYIWREGIHRNQWIRQQGGERIKFFIKRTSGVPCGCKLDARSLTYSKQPSGRCMTCFGTGFVGGYEGPFDGIISPDDAERRFSQSDRGRTKEHSQEVWTGPSPILTQRDFLVKLTNERYSVGPVRRPTARGMVLQQHFNMAYLDEGDIRYNVPIDGVSALAWPETRYSQEQAPSMPVDGSLPAEAPFPVTLPAETPMATDKSNIPDERERRGRSPVWSNIEY